MDAGPKHKLHTLAWEPRPASGAYYKESDVALFVVHPSDIRDIFCYLIDVLLPFLAFLSLFWGKGERVSHPRPRLVPHQQSTLLVIVSIYAQITGATDWN